MALLLKNIACLAGITSENQLLRGSNLSGLQTLSNAYLLMEGDRIAAFGNMASMPASYQTVTEQIDVTGRFVLPAWCDSHTHLVFPRSREDEFVDKLRGLSYAEIAGKGGGILNSARQLNEMSEDDLFALAWPRLQEAMLQGTGAIEIKSGYGIARLKQAAPIPVKATFLGAHAFPLLYKQNHPGYIDLIINQMLPAITQEGLADYIDVFCDKGFFSPQQTDIILNAGAKYGLKAKIHGNELGFTGGVQTAIKNNALSVDHLEYTGEDEINCLLQSNTMPVALPGCSFFLGIPYAPVRKMIDAGLPVCLATDYNPGSTPNGRMGFVLSLACTQMKLTPEEAFNATTINGAFALEMSDKLGSITIGKTANLIITKPVNSLAYLPYAFGDNNIGSMVINGQLYVG